MMADSCGPSSDENLQRDNEEDDKSKESLRVKVKIDLRGILISAAQRGVTPEQLEQDYLYVCRAGLGLCKRGQQA